MKKIILAAVLLFISAIPLGIVFAKGEFNFIIIKAESNTEIRFEDTSSSLVKEFFAFADFFNKIQKIEAPADPGTGYEITRYYIDNGKESAFDHLHYYPEKGFVYYDGLVGGYSEYDKQWYKAKPEIKETFLNIAQPVLEKNASQKPEYPSLTPLLVGLVLSLVFISAFFVNRTRSNSNQKH